MTRKILGEGVIVVECFVGGVVEDPLGLFTCDDVDDDDDTVVVEAFILATLIRFCSELCCEVVDAGTDKMFVRERDFIILIGVEVLVCMRLISESSSSSYSLQL